MINENEHTYNLKAVVQETGLKPVTIRAWERRYGLPKPERTAGGHRLYSQRDMDILKWLIARQQEGVSISRAVAMWQSLEAEGQNPLTSASPVSGFSSPTSLPETSTNLLADLRQAWIKACLAFDQDKIDQVMQQAFSRFAAEIICIEILQKGLAEIGQGWFEHKVTVQQEHFASAQAMRRLELLVAAQAAPTRPERILVACAPRDTHTFSALLLTFLLGRYGWEVVYLGADVPSSQLPDTLKATKPELLIFTAQQLYTAVSLLNISEIAQNHQIPLAFGGLAFIRFPGLKEKIPGFYLGDDLLTCPLQTQQILLGQIDFPSVAPIGPEFRQARLAYEQARNLIEAAVWNEFLKLASQSSVSSEGDSNLSPDLLTDINAHFSKDIIASLRFGDINLLNPNMEWLEQLVENYGWPKVWLHKYFDIFQQAAQKHLDDDHPLIKWLSQKE